MRKGILLFVLLVMGSLSLQAQKGSVDPLQNFREAGERGEARIETDSLLEANYYKLRIQNSKSKGIPGYRIRIYSDSGLGAKEEQQKVRARFLTLFPEIDAYNKYDEPYFKVYVGDCRTKSEALLLFDQIKKHFPNPILVEDDITIQ